MLKKTFSSEVYPLISASVGRSEQTFQINGTVNVIQAVKSVINRISANLFLLSLAKSYF